MVLKGVLTFGKVRVTLCAGGSKSTYRHEGEISSRGGSHFPVRQVFSADERINVSHNLRRYVNLHVERAWLPIAPHQDALAKGVGFVQVPAPTIIFKEVFDIQIEREPGSVTTREGVNYILRETKVLKLRPVCYPAPV